MKKLGKNLKNKQTVEAYDTIITICVCSCPCGSHGIPSSLGSSMANCNSSSQRG